jgi:hypothetical protein
MRNSSSASTRSATCTPPAANHSPRRVRMVVTPELAKQWLEANTHNRPLSETLVITYMIDMLEGRWQYNGDAIRFDHMGRLIDGQHRLRACVEAGVPFETDVVTGLDPDAIRTIDIGRVRTAGHIAHIEGVENADLACAIAAMVLLHRKHGIEHMNDPRRKPTKTEIVEAVRTLDGIQAAVARARKLGRRIAPPRVIGFCFLVFAEQNRKLAERFFDELEHGLNLSQDNPVYHMRERLLSNRQSKAKLPQLNLVALFFKAWLAYRDGRPMQRLFWKNDGPAPEKFPSIDER